MPYKKGESGNPKRQFSKENQPSPENKSKGKLRISRMKDALEFLATQFHSVQRLEDGSEVELTLESTIAYQLLKKAQKGDVQAIKLLADIHGWNAPQKVDNTFSDGDGKPLFRPGNKVEFKIKFSGAI